MALGIDASAVVRGAGIGLAIALPVALAAQLLDAAVDLDRDSSLPALFYLGIVAGFVVGGRAAGLRSPDRPLTNGAAAGFTTYVALAVISAVRLTIAGDGIPAAALLFNTMISSTAGLFGGMLAARRHARTRIDNRDGPGVLGEKDPR